MSHINRGDVHAYLDGALGAYTEEAARHVREHLDACGECAQLLEDERRLREEATAILAASATGPVELEPFEELLAKASRTDGQVPADVVEGVGRAERGPFSLGSRLYSLRWAATVVVSLGAGWLARDLSGPARDLARGPEAESLETVGGLRSSGDLPGVERDNLAQLTEAETALQEASSPAGRFADEETVAEPASDLDSRLAEVATPLESQGAVATEVAGADANVDAARVDDDRVLDQVEVGSRQRSEAVTAQAVAPAAAQAVAPADADVTGLPAERRLQAPSASDELRDSRRAVGRWDADAGTTSFLVPGLPVRDIRIEPEADSPTGAVPGSVTVIQELEDGRVVELRFVPLAEGDPAVDGVLRERRDLLGRTQPVGWATTVRMVSAGAVFLSGPLSEPELAGLLDLVVGPR